MYSENNIRNELQDKNSFFRFIFEKEVTSTNDLLNSLAKKGEEEGLVMLSMSQTKGKGRMGRTFYSPQNSGIYMSILLRPSVSPSECNLLTPMTAVAATKAIEEVLSVKTDIKWVNDIYINGKKAAGILTKAAFSSGGKTDYVIVGTGINLTVPEGGFEDDIKDIAGALKEEVTEKDRDKLVGVFLREFLSYYEKLTEREYYDEYRKRLLYLGEKISVREKEDIYDAEAVDIDESFRLKIRMPDGKEKILYTEEISIRQK